MKICFLTHNIRLDNGGGVLSFKIIEGIRSFFGGDVYVLTGLPGGQKYEKTLLTNSAAILKNFFRIRKIFKECDVIHAMDTYPYGIIAALASLGLGKKIIITAVGSGSIIPLYSKIFFLPSVFSCKRADAIVAISNFTKREILKRVPGLNIRVINPGIDFGKFSKTSSLGLPGEFAKLQPYILSVGALRWRKGYRLSIKAFAEVSKAFPELKYLIVGKKYTDKYYDQLKKLIADLGLGGKVVIVDSLDHEKYLGKSDSDMLGRVYGGAELFFLMSQAGGHDIEGFGLVFLEAAASGLPAIGSRDCGAEDAILDGKNGFLADAKDIGGFADAIKKILGDANLKKKMSEESRKFAAASVWDRRTEEYVQIYKTLLKPSKTK
ncbi:hypothetical protein A2924_02325 [Candidatus Giovannonibacteria bacterium RIFCSPLOWO2_01_FULL_44_16]|uniref:Glycosyl transferase family 1 domain-containing protein n=1 Tax=Candidatus Giovannonibacteria bacterium RIFCSPLOWO2_01_FULL_44_16 TaxID=1798348 RepID=A0A1F5X5Y6_9BACT|nr:MAG: hypothetical protein A2924_02325 [Candidatus Giovannonibacteria bacterium RIFCSPLOWO2_01_FULL_44_16]